ncbi:MAG TPA: hypothetical protein VHG28_00085 [Longimicrobiaceae bacterium]|nr:hypothetical protein [Longimicrobiaceae bacterium]
MDKSQRAGTRISDETLQLVEEMRDRVLTGTEYGYLSHLARHLIEREIPAMIQEIRRLRGMGEEHPSLR